MSTHANPTNVPGLEGVDHAPIAASFSLYAGDIRKLEDAFNRGRTYAEDNGYDFLGASFDVDDNGYVFVHIAGLDPVRL